MDFDILTEREAFGMKIEYGILQGSKNIVFVKSGRGGTHHGEEEKYLRFAAYLRESFGASVVCASNPDGCKSTVEADMSVLNEYMRGFDMPRLWLWGISDGAFKCIDVAEHMMFEKAVLVNMPLMINFYKNKERLKKLDAARLAFAYGEFDPSFKYVPFLRSLESSALLTLEKTGHLMEMNVRECEFFGKILFS